MKKKRKAPAAKPRNPHARVLGSGPFKPRVMKDPDAYTRKPRHRKPVKIEEDGGDSTDRS